MRSFRACAPKEPTGQDAATLRGKVNFVVSTAGRCRRYPTGHQAFVAWQRPLTETLSPSECDADHRRSAAGRVKRRLDINRAEFACQRNGSESTGANTFRKPCAIGSVSLTMTSAMSA